MREEYINKVKKKLAVSHKHKYEIIRDLNEAFDSAKEHGETEKQVIDRLGTPEDFAENMEETLGFNRAQDRRGRKKRLTACCSCIAVFCLIGAWRINNSAFPDNAIGQADAMTTIKLNGCSFFDMSSALLLIGITFAIVALVLLVGLTRRKQ